jgi:hypothetical protein
LTAFGKPENVIASVAIGFLAKTFPKPGYVEISPICQDFSSHPLEAFKNKEAPDYQHFSSGAGAHGGRF